MQSKTKLPFQSMKIVAVAAPVIVAIPLLFGIAFQLIVLAPLRVTLGQVVLSVHVCN